MDDNEAIRAAAIWRCRLLALSWGDAIPAAEAARGFPRGYGRLKLITRARGIPKPQQLTDGPITLVSSLASPSEGEHLNDDALLRDCASSPSNDWDSCCGRSRPGRRIGASPRGWCGTCARPAPGPFEKRVNSVSRPRCCP